MGIFNEQNNNPSGKGIQGAPGIGFSLTADGNYDMINRKLTNVGAPSANADAATKKYVDDNSSSSTSRLTVDSDINMRNRYRITSLKSPIDSDEPATKQYADSTFLDRDGSRSMIGDLSMNNKKIKNVGTPTSDTDAATKKYVDDKGKTSGLTIDSNIDMKRTYRITNLKAPMDGNEPATKDYTDNTFLDRDGSYPMKGNLDMDNYRIYNLPAPTGPKQPIPLSLGDLKYLHVGGTNYMLNILNMNNKKIINLAPPFNDTDAATKKYVDDNSGSPDLSDYLEKDGSVAMTGNLNLNNKKITNLSKPTQDNDAVNKDYADHLIHHTAVQPSHYNNQFTYLMSNAAQWTDEIDTGTSFVIEKIVDLPPSKGNFHTYNHRVIYVKLNKNSQGGYKYKMAVNFYRLAANVDYTLCLEILNKDYQLWHKSQISVDKGTSTGLTIENVSVKKLSHRYTDAANNTQFMYYHRIIVNFRKLSVGNSFFLHFLVNIPQEGTDLSTYPNQFLGVYWVTYGIVGKVSDIDPDKVYDYHTAFDIKPTEVTYNVDINANNKKILNINLDRNNNNSVATVGMVKEIPPFTKNYIYRKHFEHFFDFTDSNNYVLNSNSFGVSFNALSSLTGNSAYNITFPTKTMDLIKKGGLNINNFTITFKPPSGVSEYTLCIVFNHHRRNNFTLSKYDITNPNSKKQFLYLYYLFINETLNLHINSDRKNLSLSSSFDGKRIVLWLAESALNNITKVNVSNMSTNIIINRVRRSSKSQFDFYHKEGIIEKFMFAPKFYDVRSLVHHEILLQEKLNGSTIL